MTDVVDAPVLEIEDAVLLTITTPVGEEDHFSTLFASKPAALPPSALWHSIMTYHSPIEQPRFARTCRWMRDAVEVAQSHTRHLTVALESHAWLQALDQPAVVRRWCQGLTRLAILHPKHPHPHVVRHAQYLTLLDYLGWSSLSGLPPGASEFLAADPEPPSGLCELLDAPGLVDLDLTHAVPDPQTPWWANVLIQSQHEGSRLRRLYVAPDVSSVVSLADPRTRGDYTDNITPQLLTATLYVVKRQKTTLTDLCCYASVEQRMLDFGLGSLQSVTLHMVRLWSYDSIDAAHWLDHLKYQLPTSLRQLSIWMPWLHPSTTLLHSWLALLDAHPPHLVEWRLCTGSLLLVSDPVAQTCVVETDQYSASSAQMEVDTLLAGLLRRMPKNCANLRFVTPNLFRGFERPGHALGASGPDPAWAGIRAALEDHVRPRRLTWEATGSSAPRGLSGKCAPLWPWLHELECSQPGWHEAVLSSRFLGLERVVLRSDDALEPAFWEWIYGRCKPPNLRELELSAGAHIAMTDQKTPVDVLVHMTKLVHWCRDQGLEALTLRHATANHSLVMRWKPELQLHLGGERVMNRAPLELAVLVRWQCIVLCVCELWFPDAS